VIEVGCVLKKFFKLLDKSESFCSFLKNLKMLRKLIEEVEVEQKREG
jgi:hypothetical protein